MDRETYLLIHGAWVGKWCWKKLEKVLQQEGLTPLALDLPGHGEKKDRLPVTMKDYVDEVVAFIRGRNVTNLVLVGHSMGGVIISKLAEQLPQRIKRLVYLAGFVLQDQESMLDNVPERTRARYRRLAEAHPKKVIPMPTEIARKYFFNAAREEDASWAASKLQPQPYQPFADRVDLSVFYTSTIPRRYVLFTQDQAMPMSYWRTFAHRLRCTPIELDADHTAMISRPRALGRLLVEMT